MRLVSIHPPAAAVLVLTLLATAAHGQRAAPEPEFDPPSYEAFVAERDRLEASIERVSARLAELQGEANTTTRPSPAEPSTRPGAAATTQPTKVQVAGRVLRLRSQLGPLLVKLADAENRPAPVKGVLTDVDITDLLNRFQRGEMTLEAVDRLVRSPAKLAGEREGVRVYVYTFNAPSPRDGERMTWTIHCDVEPGTDRVRHARGNGEGDPKPKESRPKR